MRGQIGFVAIDGFDELANDVFTESKEKNGENISSLDQPGLLIETYKPSSRPTSKALDRLEMQNQKFLGAQGEIDASLCRACVMFCRRFGPRPKVSCVIFLNT
nr:uncharacterized protein LOC118878042 isoform X2 [Drosophila suzukii]